MTTNNIGFFCPKCDRLFQNVRLAWIPKSKEHWYYCEDCDETLHPIIKVINDKEKK